MFVTSSEQTATPVPARGHSAARVQVVRVLPVGGRRPTTAMLDGIVVEIGREGHVRGPLALADGEASRQHAALERDDHGWSIVDRGSRNGTFVDGVRIDRAALRDGAVIRVGKT